MISMHSPLGHGLRAAFGAFTSLFLILGLAPKVVFAQAGPEPAGGHRLATSKSAYLRMHAKDPIQWWPWGEEPFARAKAENKPIFLSIGFSSCHWCHVMHRESFKDPRVAEVLNRSFIAIKLDREERPDVDRIYMEAALLHGTNGAGWPASIFLDQDRRPFLLGNYFPPEAAHGRKGFRDLLLELEKAWKEDRTALLEVAARITADLARAQDHERGDELPDARIFGRARFVFDQMEDKRHGGFGEAPKFPHPMAHLFLLRESAREQMPVLADPVRLALIAMRNSALCDQIDGGFHRYCVDAAWADPHFEQLLEDQALHAWLFLEAGVALKDPHFLREAEVLLERARTVFAHESGGFQHAIDSGVAGVEGAHATFSRKDLSAALPEDLLPLALEHFGLSETETFLEERHALRIVRTAEELAAAHELSESLVKERLKAVRAVLSAARKSQPKARIDAKIALGPNALMVHAFAHSALLTGNAEHLAIAQRHFQFLEEHHARKKGPWARVTSGKVAEFDGDLLDHAAVLWAALRLHEASFDQKDLDRARAMAELIEAQFGKADGRFVDAISEDLVVQMAVLREAQSPSGAGLTVLGLAKLGAITGEPRWIERADRALLAVSGLLTSEPALSQTHLLALDDRLRNAPRITWTGPRDHPELLALRRAALSEYWPFVVHTQADTDDGAFVGAVVCVEETCFAPARTMAELREQIRAALDY